MIKMIKNILEIRFHIENKEPFCGSYINKCGEIGRFLILKNIYILYSYTNNCIHTKQKAKYV